MFNIGIFSTSIYFNKYINELIWDSFENFLDGGEIIFFTKGEEIVSCERKFEFLFLDIDIGVIVTMNIAFYLEERKRKNANENIKIVVLTNELLTVDNSLNTQKFILICKANLKDEVFNLLKQLEKNIGGQAFVEICHNNKKKYIRKSEIKYITSHHNGSEIWMENENCRCDFCLSELMKILDKKLFCQCHRSNIVNLKYINFIDNFVNLYGGEKLLISKRKRKILIEKYQYHRSDK